MAMQQPAAPQTLPLFQLSKDSVGYVHCPFCRQNGFTKTKKKYPLATHCIALACCLGFCIGCFAYCVPFLIDVVHRCSFCNAKLATCKGDRDQASLPRETQQALLTIGQYTHPAQQYAPPQYPQQQPPQWGHYPAQPGQSVQHQQPVPTRYSQEVPQFQARAQRDSRQLQPQETGIMYTEDARPVSGYDTKKPHHGHHSRNYDSVYYEQQPQSLLDGGGEVYTQPQQIPQEQQPMQPMEYAEEGTDKKNEKKNKGRSRK